jgi:hypothetical protein
MTHMAHIVHGLTSTDLGKAKALLQKILLDGYLSFNKKRYIEGIKENMSIIG